MGKRRLQNQISSGGIVFRKINDQREFLLIKDHIGKWAIPKGIIEKNLDPEENARKEILEETGLKDLKTITQLDDLRYFFRSGEKLIRKQVKIFLLQTVGNTDLNPENFDPKEKLIQDAGWFLEDGVKSKLGYKNLQPIFEKAIKILKKG